MYIEIYIYIYIYIYIFYLHIPPESTFQRTGHVSQDMFRQLGGAPSSHGLVGRSGRRKILLDTFWFPLSTGSDLFSSFGGGVGVYPFWVWISGGGGGGGARRSETKSAKVPNSRVPFQWLKNKLLTCSPNFLVG